MFDTDDGGEVTVEEFADCMKRFGSALTVDEISELVHELDENQDGTINVEEFAEMLKKHAAASMREDDKASQYIGPSAEREAGVCARLPHTQVFLGDTCTSSRTWEAHLDDIGAMLRAFRVQRAR
jgi:hypothetical protein